MESKTPARKGGGFFVPRFSGHFVSLRSTHSVGPPHILAACEHLLMPDHDRSVAAHSATEWNPTPDVLTRTVRTNITVCACTCWVWTGSCDTHGYSKAKIKGKTVVLHRYVWEFFHDRPLGGYDDTIDHLCNRHRACLNPDHMEVVTRSINSSRANDRRWHEASPDRSACTVGETSIPPRNGDQPTTTQTESTTEQWITT